MPRHGLIAAAGVGLIALTGAALLAWATPDGLGLSRDSVAYLRFARVIVGLEPARTNLGLHAFLTHYPPGYPLLLAIGAASLTWAKWLNLLCYMTAVACTAWAVWTGHRSFQGSSYADRPSQPEDSNLANNSPIARTILAAIAVSVSAVLVPQHLWLASEPPFLAAVAIVMVVLVRYHRRPVAPLAFVAGVVIGVGLLMRYVGGAFLPAACCSVLLARDLPLRTRWRHAVWVVAGALPAMLLLPIFHRLLGESVGHRSIEYHPLRPTHWHDFAATVGGWLAPRYSTATTYAGLAVALVLIVVVLARRGPRHGARAAAPAVVLYPALLVASLLFIDNATPLDDRLLAPVGLALLVWIAIDWPTSDIGPSHAAARVAPPPPGERTNGAIERALNGFVRTRPHIGVLIATSIVVVLTLAAGMTRTIADLRTSRAGGLGFNHGKFRTSPLIDRCRTLPPWRIIYSAYPEPILIHARRDARFMPAIPTELGRGDGSFTLEAAVAQMKQELEASDGYIAYFNFRVGRRVASRPIPLEQLRQMIPLKVIAETPDGTLLQIDRAGP